MVHARNFILLAALSLAVGISRAFAHGHDEEETKVVSMGSHVANGTATHSAVSSASMASVHALQASENYFAYPEFQGLMLAHIVLMTIAWFFLLPIGVMLSVARSRLGLVVQLSFLGLHSIGLLLGTIYTYNTPQLYENNSHNKLGWIVTWVVVVQCILGIIRLAASIRKGEHTATDENAALFGANSQMSEHREENHHQGPSEPYESYARDSGHFTASDSSRTQSVSSSTRFTQGEEQKDHGYESGHDDDSDCHHAEKRGLLGNQEVERLVTKLNAKLSRRMMRIIDISHNFIDRTILLMGFIAFVTGLAVYGGVFRGHEIFNGLAHTIKGGIFFWYGLLTLGRWMGCFVEYGWAWNIRPPIGVVSARKARIPSAEFVESFVIFLYGSTNVFLEHLAAWGRPWSPMDLEHLSITIMFFGGGLCGMLVESTRVRDLLNSVMLTSPAARGQQPVRASLTPPKTYSFPMNPFPGLVILLLGLMMSSHHQHSMVSTTIHKQWGSLFIGFAVARAVTYILTYISPPSSYLPSRPPSELISAFCLISGGLIFMASNRDTVNALEDHGIHAMFPFTVTMGLTAFTMAWSIIVLAIKGWAVRRNQPAAILSGNVET